MNKRVWIFQVKKHIELKGADRASWYIGWYDLHGKRHSESCGPGSRGRNLAEKRLRRIQGELDLGVHQPPSKMMWTEFCQDYKNQVLSRLEPSSQRAITVALDSFERHIKPGRVEAISTKTIDAFITARRNDKGKNPGSTVSPATINKDLRHLKAALRRAHDWGFLPTLPKIRMVRELEKIPRFVTADHFGIIYSKACAEAELPLFEGQRYSPVQWWKGLVVTAYMTGLRIMEILAIRRVDLDLTGGALITRAKDNKGKRDEKLKLHPVVIDHLRQLESSDSHVMPWPHDPRMLWTEFGRIQRKAGIHLPCPEDHKHTPACHVYGFHDFRRAFATVNAPRMKPEALQKLMRHKSYKTTLVYINLASQIDDAVADMPIPDVLQAKENAETSTLSTAVE